MEFKLIVLKSSGKILVLGWLKKDRVGIRANIYYC